jgi:hypothetical protein
MLSLPIRNGEGTDRPNGTKAIGGLKVGLYSVISALAATTVGVSALSLAAAVRLGARSEETLVVPAPRRNPRRDRNDRD